MERKELIIYFDSDGVLADMKGFMDTHGIPYNPDGVCDKEVDKIMWGELSKIPNFYAKFDELDGVKVLKNLQNKGEHCEVLTAIPKPHWNITGAGEDKIQWVREHLGDTPVRIVYRAEKKELATDKFKVLVDDLEVNIREWTEAGGTGILFTGEKDFDYGIIDRLRSELETQG